VEERGGGRDVGVLPRAKLPLLKLMTCAPSASCSSCSSTLLQALLCLADSLTLVVPSMQQRPREGAAASMGPPESGSQQGRAMPGARFSLFSSESCLLSKRGCLNSLLILQGKEGGLNSMTIMEPYMGIWAYTHAGNTDSFL